MTLERRSREPGEVLPNGTLIKLPEGTLTIDDLLAKGGSAYTHVGFLEREGQSSGWVGVKIFRNFYPSGEHMDPYEPENEATVQRRLMDLEIPHILPQQLNNLPKTWKKKINTKCFLA